MRQADDGKDRVLTRGGLTDVSPQGGRSKACREKSAEAVVLPDGWQEGPKLMEVMPKATEMIMQQPKNPQTGYRTEDLDGIEKRRAGR
jgi:hypothetical protein